MGWHIYCLYLSSKENINEILENNSLMKNDRTNRIRVKGLVIPNKWDKDGNVTGIAIAEYDEKESTILMDRIGRSLMALLHEKVVIEGKKDKTDNKDIIEVKRFDKDPM
jgi:hypothetical protein